ncbi:hypothetical protein R1flu_017314 [Riccia fluitans]|uniref:Uncharacterized protein n=1 Tax=Riccia fluitans TaxID=41844 RepID=A0ABD1ZCL6_9MARC
MTRPTSEGNHDEASPTAERGSQQGKLGRYLDLTWTLQWEVMMIVDHTEPRTLETEDETFRSGTRLSREPRKQSRLHTRNKPQLEPLCRLGTQREIIPGTRPTNLPTKRHPSTPKMIMRRAVLPRARKQSSALEPGVALPLGGGSLYPSRLGVSLSWELEFVVLESSKENSRTDP